jgi:putative endonuclease
MYIKNKSDFLRTRKELGAYGESLAAKYLLDVLGWKIHKRNWRCKSGEIDIVAHDGHSIILVEVRTRSEGGHFGTAVDSVNERKLLQMKRVGRIYIYTHTDLPERLVVRFDLIAIQVCDGVTVDFIHYQNIIY